jgi:hypothetical protein
MGKAKKSHSKKIKNRNKQKADKAIHIKRLRTKIIQEMIREREAEHKAAEAAGENTADDSKNVDVNALLEDTLDKEIKKS